MSQALYRKWRPKKWDEVIGQPHIVQTLCNAIIGQRVMHAYLFSGPRGTGKTTVARLLAKAVNCLAGKPADRPCNECAHCVAVNENRFLDLIEIDAASNTSVDDVRDLRDKINFTPTQGEYKIYIIDEVHMLSTAAFNALLKTLEEPPPHAIFVLATTEIHKIPATVLSRCQRHEFRRVPVNEIIEQLKRIVESESLKVESEAITLIARQATGSVRDAISLLDQLASTGQTITLDLSQTVLGTATSQTIIELVASIRDRQPARGLERIHRALDSGADPRALARQIVDYLRALMLFQMGNGDQVEATAEMRAHMAGHAEAFSTSELLRMMRAFNAVAMDTRGGWQPSLGLELALAEVLEAPQDVAAPPSAPQREKPPAPSSQRAMPEASSRGIPLRGSAPKGVARGVQKEPIAPVRERPASAQEVSSLEAKPGGSTVSLDQVAADWKQIRAIIKPQNPTLDGLLNSCKLLEVKDGVLVLGFASEVLRSKMDKPEQLETTRQVIAQVVGADMPIRCVVSNAKQSAPPDVKQDGMVATALQAGGEIVDVQ